MTKPPSRNEIESALDANRPNMQAGSKHSDKPDLFNKQNHRDHNIIGGDLTGISTRRKPKSNWLNFKEYNYINWIAGFIVLMIAAVFFWPEQSHNPVNNPPRNQASKDSPSTRMEPQDNDALSETVFSREDDLQRANQFRDEEVTEQRANNILITAKTLMRKGQYSTPAENNAIAKFKQVLVLDPRNSEAKQGLDYIKSRYLAAGERAIGSGNVASASANLKKIGIIDSESDEYLALASQIESLQLNQQIKKLLVQAKSAIENEQLIRPANNSARYFYQQILELEPENTAALEGIKAIADSFVEKAQQATNEGKYEAATGYLTTVSLIAPQHPAIAKLEPIIAKAKATKKPPTKEQNKQTWLTSTTTKPEQTPTKTSIPTQTSSTENKGTKTPASVSQERQLIDRQYLKRGLDAYYRGDYEVARSLLKPLADKGVSRAQLRLGYMHLLGRGVEKSRSTADQIIRAALPAVQKFADEGRAWAQSDIGSLYEDGLVLPQNFDEAIFWYQSAARQGYAGAQTNLGVMYAEGKGVTRNNKTAIDWFKKAAAQGDIAAKKNLKALNIKP